VKVLLYLGLGLMGGLSSIGAATLIRAAFGLGCW